MTGYFGIGVYHPKTEANIGTLWRGAYQLGASFIFTIGRRYSRQSSDVYKSWKHIPLFEFSDVEGLFSAVYDCEVIAVEMGGKCLTNYSHPERCIYLLGAEDHGLPVQVVNRCHDTVSIPSIRQNSYNVAQSGTLVMYNRIYG